MRGAKGIKPGKRILKIVKKQNSVILLVGSKSIYGWWVGSSKEMGISVLGQDPRKEIAHRVLGGFLVNGLQVPAPNEGN